MTESPKATQKPKFIKGKLKTALVTLAIICIAAAVTGGSFLVLGFDGFTIIAVFLFTIWALAAFYMFKNGTLKTHLLILTLGIGILMAPPAWLKSAKPAIRVALASVVHAETPPKPHPEDRIIRDWFARY